MQLVGNKKYGKVKVKKTSPRMDEVPEDCGYMQQFEFAVVTLNEYHTNHWEAQNAYMSFERKRDATRFWMTVGIQNSGKK